ncbi:ExbD/TolR family protein [Microbulbifer zhoushanensis]|uniref:ExbD/TolR family protein n=1 Tax=Microbulbifer zhoushanensis TaxID=2904254 RepID=UPI001F3D94F3|nr:biopolymer transporter ExbD [Microbulbifer zhoushanensis]
MRRRRHGRDKEAPELDITAFLNLMVVLVPFLLVSAVFSRVTIMELNMPSGAGGGAPDDPTVTVEVVVRQDRLEISDGEKVIARFPNPGQESESPEGSTGEQAPVADAGEEEASLRQTEEVYDLAKLSAFLLKIKGNYPEKTDAMVLLEPDIPYEYLVGVMDTIRGAEVRREGSDPSDPESVERVELFPDISIGDAP